MAHDDNARITVRSLRVTDVPSVVEVHLAGFPGFFLTFLGSQFLSSFYREIAEDPNGIAFVATRNGAVCGFVAGVLDQPRFYRHLIRNRLPGFASAAARAAIRRPSIAPRLLRALRRPGDANEAFSQTVLMSLAVEPGFRERGIGSNLVRAFLAALVERRATSVCLTTDATDNDTVNRFYIHLGFESISSFKTPEGRAMTEYGLTLGDTNSD